MENNNTKEKKYFLKKVIQRLPGKSKSSKPNTVVTRYPSKAGILGLLGKKEIKYFEVSNNNDNRNYAENIQNIKIDDFDTGMNILITLQYRLTCPAGKEAEVTEFLGKDDTPERTLTDFIDMFAHQFYNDRIDGFVENLEENLKDLVRSLDSEITAVSGLKCVSKASLKNADNVKDIQQTNHIKVVPKDMERWIPIKVDYILRVHNRNVAALHMNNDTDINKVKEEVAEAMVKYIGENITAHQLFFHFMNKEKELVELTEVLNRLLAPYGRRIQLGKMVAENVYLKRFDEVEVENKRIPIDRNTETIVIKNRLQFELEDAGKYLESRMPSLKEWASNELNNLFAVKVFDWEYIDFLVNFEKLKSELELSMREKAAMIGYRINQIISEPKLEENAFLRMDTHMFEYQKLSTADSGITADFNVTVTFMLNDKEAFRELLKYDDNAKESLRKMFEVELKKVLSYESPERIFLQYYNEQFQGKGESLKNYLENQVKQHLVGKLNATIQDIHIVPVDNGILKPLYEVRGQSRNIEFELTPQIEGDPILYRATLVVHGQDNNNWSQLIEGKYTMASIVELVIRTLQAEFNMLSEEELRFKSLEHRRAIEKIADTLAKKVVSKRYGLIVEIENLDRDKNTEEALASANKRKKLEYIHSEKDANLDFLSERNRQDREQLLHLSRALDEEDMAEIEEYEKRVGMESIDILTKDENKNTGLSGLMRLAEETSTTDMLENYSSQEEPKKLEKKQDSNEDE